MINKSTITLFSTALLLRIGMFIAIEANPAGFANRFISPDVLEYHRIAQNLANNGIFSDSPSAPHNPRLERTPLYPLFIAAHYLTGTYGGHLAIVFQILLSSLTGVLTYWIGRQWFSERIAFIAGIILACDYTGILYSNTFYSETLFTLLFLLHIYFLGKYVQSGQPFDTSAGSVQRRLRTSSSAVSSQLSALRHFGRLSAAQAQDKLFSGQSFGFAQDAKTEFRSQYSIDNLQYSIITLALATLTRPVSVYWIFCLVPIISWQHRFTLAKPLIHFCLITFTFLLLLFPWSLRYHSFTGKWLISSQQEEVFWWNTHNLHKLYAEESGQPSAVSGQWSAYNGIWENELMSGWGIGSKKEKGKRKNKASIGQQSMVSRQPSALRRFGRLSAAQAKDKLISGQSFGFDQGSEETAFFASGIRNPAFGIWHPASGIRHPELVLSPDSGKASGSMISSSTFNFPISNSNFQLSIINSPLPNFVSEETIQAIGRDSQHYLKGMINFFTVISSSDVFRILGMDATLIGDPEYGSTRFAFLNQLLSQKRPAELAVMGILGCYLLLLYGFAGFGGYTLLRQQHYFVFLLLAMIVGYFLLASAPAAFTAKYRMPVLPVIALFAAVGINNLKLGNTDKKRMGEQPFAPDSL